MITAYHSGYLQDDFRATGKLTLNLGIRYEYEPGQKEENNKYAVGFDKNISLYVPMRNRYGRHMRTAQAG